MWSFWPSHQRPLLLSKISRNKTSEKERCTPLGESWIVYIFIAWGNKLSYFCINRKTLGRYSHKLSIISKQSRLMHTELRYQVKTYTISNMPREKKNPPNSPQFFFLNAIWKWHHMQGKIKPVNARWCQYRKTVARPAYSVFPNKYLENSLKRNKG
jgi:hypothetical protein